jgi:hypothetical protein
MRADGHTTLLTGNANPRHPVIDFAHLSADGSRVYFESASNDGGGNGLAEMQITLVVGSQTVSVDLQGFVKQGGTPAEDVCEFNGVATVAS